MQLNVRDFSMRKTSFFTAFHPLFFLSPVCPVNRGILSPLRSRHIIGIGTFRPKAASRPARSRKQRVQSAVKFCPRGKDTRIQAEAGTILCQPYGMLHHIHTAHGPLSDRLQGQKQPDIPMIRRNIRWQLQSQMKMIMEP